MPPMSNHSSCLRRTVLCWGIIRIQPATLGKAAGQCLQDIPDRFDRISYVETANLHHRHNASQDLPLYQGAFPKHVQSMCASNPPLLLAEIMEAAGNGH